MTTFSPAAKAVMTAFAKASDGEYVDGEWQQDSVGQLAAAICAAADQVVPETVYESYEVFMIAMNVRHNLLAIAAELEAQS
jgi:hypothetical protein